MQLGFANLPMPNEADLAEMLQEAEGQPIKKPKTSATTPWGNANKSQQKSTTPTKKLRQTVLATRWALGSLSVPADCGGKFKYRIKSYGSFEDSTAAIALAAYFTVMTDGIMLLQSLRQRQGVTPYPISGKQLKFRTLALRLGYYRSPFSEGEWCAPISQGEFWKGSLSRKN